MQENIQSHIINCPLCGIKANETSHRLIKEYCGHTKCRQCLLKEINGCSMCKQTSDCGNDIKSLLSKNNDKLTTGQSIDSLNLIAPTVQSIDVRSGIESDDESNSDKLQIDTDLENSIDDKQVNINSKQVGLGWYFPVLNFKQN